MGGNTFGTMFRVTTFGESHGRALGVVVDGCPPGIALDEDYIAKELARRRPGQSGVTTQRNESDAPKVLSGVFRGKTTGAPIAIIILNKDADPAKYESIKNIFRPGHADYTYFKKYGIRDYRGSGRASGRETAARVAAGAVAKRILLKAKVKVFAYTLQVGPVRAKDINLLEIENNPLRCPDREKAKKMAELIEKVRKKGDSIGGIVECVVKNCPVGLGEPVFDKLSADIAKAEMSIPSVKGIEIGSGFAVAKMKGSECNDPLYIKDGDISFKTNNSGGILGGISNGCDIVFRVAVKPTSSILREQKTVTVDSKEAFVKIDGRHDPCICPRAVPVVEAMAAIVIADHLLRNKAQCDTP